MKTYVLGYRPKPIEDKATEETERPKRIEVQFPEYEIHYSDRPEWRLGALELAEADCRLLNSMQVHVGPHYCQFEIEELEPGLFAIVCKSHPDKLR